MNVTEVRSIIKKRCAAAGSLRRYAEAIDLSPAYVSEVLRGDRPPGPVILEDLGLEKVIETSYRRVRREAAE